MNAEDENGWTLLLHACTGPEHDDRYEPRDDEAYVDLVRYLITQGADVHHRPRAGDDGGSSSRTRRVPAERTPIQGPRLLAPRRVSLDATLSPAA